MASIEELSSYADKQPVNELKGKIDKVFDFQSKEGEYGPYCTQGIIVSQGQQSAYVQLGNKPEVFESDKGKDITLQSVSTDRGFGGVAVGRYINKSGEDAFSVKVNKGGFMSIGGKATNTHNARTPSKHSPTTVPTGKTFESWAAWWNMLEGRFKTEDVRWKASFSFWHAGVDLPVTEEDIYKMEAKSLEPNFQPGDMPPF